MLVKINLKIKNYFLFLFCICIANFLNANQLKIDEKANIMINHVKQSIIKSENQISKLSNEILDLKGMSSYKVRHLLNNICSFHKVRYLEIGVWQGSTFISALYNNNLIDAVAIDNWSEFGGPKNEFLTNTKLFLKNQDFRFYEIDAFKLDKKSVFKDGKINVYFYDGNHSEISQKLAFTYFNDIFDDVFVALIDDWNWESVKKGTFKAFQELKYKVLFYEVLPGLCINDSVNWWNGIFIAVISKV